MKEILDDRDGDRLVYLRQSADGPGRGNLNFSVPEVRDLRNGVPALSGIAEYSSWSAILRSPVVGIVACWIPALRAARIDPAITMGA